jgi:hypothetical protein
MGEIARVLAVSKSSVSCWTRDIRLSSDQVLNNWRLNQSAEAVERRTRARSDKCRARRLAAQVEGRSMATSNDLMHAMGCMLYWSEGSKDRNMLTFANSDVSMVQFFARFLRECLGIPDERMTVRLNVYLGNGLSLEAIENHWLQALSLPRSCLRGHQIDHYPTSSSGTRLNKLPYGVCALRVLRSTPILQHIFGAIQEYGGFEEPKWLG